MGDIAFQGVDEHERPYTVLPTKKTLEGKAVEWEVVRDKDQECLGLVKRMWLSKSQPRWQAYPQMRDPEDPDKSRLVKTGEPTIQPESAAKIVAEYGGKIHPADQ